LEQIGGAFFFHRRDRDQGMIGLHQGFEFLDALGEGLALKIHKLGV
jgi:hypothetical protein